MNYQSTRGKLFADVAEALLNGIAPDGGLYVDPSLSERLFDWRACLTLSPLEMQSRILAHLLPGIAGMDSLVRDAYAGKFETDELTPLVRVGDDYILELFRGPTAAFKDVALSMLPRLITAAKEQTDDHGESVILTATSGDTGKAALEGFHNVPGTRIFVFYPDGGVSAIQRLQMTTQDGENVYVCAVKGNFDDCQAGVKRAFSVLSGSDRSFAVSGACVEASGNGAGQSSGGAEASGNGAGPNRDCAGRDRDRSGAGGKKRSLSSANSINIGRLAPQLVYYFIAYASLLREDRISLGEPVDYVVPTGNFGDILAGWMAKQLGLPVGRLICASNANRVLTDFFESGTYDRRREFYRTESPSMDILVSSNLERLLFSVSGGDAALVRKCMEELAREGFYRFPEALMEKLREDFSAYCCPSGACSDAIGRLWREHGYLCDTHTAVAVFAAEAYKKERRSRAPLVILSTASPFKFPAAVLRAIGGKAEGDEFAQMDELSRLTALPLPRGLAGLRGRRELHRDVIEVGDMIPYIIRKLNEEE